MLLGPDARPVDDGGTVAHCCAPERKREMFHCLFR
jgi:hypothetical protein